MSVATPEEVLAFWFPIDASATLEQIMEQVRFWFAGGSNDAVRARFVPTLEAAARGELDHWAKTAQGRLALILVFDQFSRAIHGGTAEAFVLDARALALAVGGIDNGMYAELPSAFHKLFFGLPLGHSEDAALHERSVALAEALIAEAPPQLRRGFEHSAGQARAHRDVIARFGRHPHRNAVLGRTSTQAELEYLATETPPHLRKPSL